MPIENMSEKINRVLADPEFRQAGAALARTVINTTISIADFAPIVLGHGEFLSWAADLGKLIRFTRKVPVVKRVTKPFDLTPDVSLKKAIASEIFEIAAFIPPTHFIESAEQFFHHDLKKIKRGHQRFFEILLD